MKIWFFEDVHLFKILCPHRFKAYKKTHSFSTFNKKDYIYFEADAANKVYLIEKGKVKIGYYTENGGEVVKAILQKGEVFGEKVLLGENTRDEFAQSLEDHTFICPMDVQTLQELMLKNKNFSLNIYKFIGLKFRKLERRMQILLFKDTRTRLLEFLDELQTDYGNLCPETGNHIIRHPYTQKDIASLIGTSRPTLNILLNELKTEGVLDFNRKEIVLLKK